MYHAVVGICHYELLESTRLYLGYRLSNSHFCASIIFIPQSHEVLIGLAEYPQGYSSRCSCTPYWSFWLGLALLSLYTWLYARYMLFGCSSRALGLLNKLIYNFSPWFFAILPLLAIFYIGIDLKRKYDLPPETKTYIGFGFFRYIVATGSFVSALIHFMENGGVVQGLEEVLSETQTGKPPTVKECRDTYQRQKGGMDNIKSKKSGMDNTYNISNTSRLFIVSSCISIHTRLQRRLARSSQLARLLGDQHDRGSNPDPLCSEPN